jgi:hypothetical protein
VLLVRLETVIGLVVPVPVFVTAVLPVPLTHEAV